MVGGGEGYVVRKNRKNLKKSNEVFSFAGDDVMCALDLLETKIIINSHV